MLLQILDQAWKDHLYAMDQLKDSVSLRGYAERDPRIEYKREGASQYVQMQQLVRDRVTELIFRAKLTPNVQPRSAYGDRQEASHADAETAVGGGEARGMGGAATAAASRGTAEQRADQDAAERAGGRGEQQLTRKQRRARAATEGKDKKKPQFKQRKRRRR